MTKEPPPTMKVKFCPRCGRDDRFQPFTGQSHLCYIGGSSAQRVDNEHLQTAIYALVSTDK